MVEVGRVAARAAMAATVAKAGATEAMEGRVVARAKAGSEAENVVAAAGRVVATAAARAAALREKVIVEAR